MSRIKVVDCTLGTNGRCIDNYFMENDLRIIQKMINKLPIEVFEYGILSGFSKGPDYAVYSTTSLPSSLDKKEGCLYSLLLDRLCHPELSSIQECSEKTADIIRVPVDNEELDSRLEYCMELKQKGYKVSVIVLEPARYNIEEKKKLYTKINNIVPWAVGLFDISGVLSVQCYEEEIKLVDSLFEQSINIEIIPKENQKLAIQVIKLASELPVDRDIFVNSSIGGYGEGELGVSTQEAISYTDSYKLDNESDSILDYIEELINRLVNKQVEENTRVELSCLYHLTGINGCSHEYAKYYHQKHVPVDELVDLFQNMSPDKKMKFTKANANEEIYRYQKGKLNLVIAVIAEKEPEKLDETLNHIADETLIYGIDCIVFDAFSSNQTRAIVNNYQLEGNINFKYRVLENESNTFDTRMFAKSVIGECLSYEYIWVIRAEIIPTISFFYYSLVEMKKSAVDFIVVDSAFRNSNRRSIKIYKNYSDFLFDNSSRLSILGTSIVSSRLIKDYFENGFADNNLLQFWLLSSSLNMLVEKKAKAGLILADTFIYDKHMFKRRFLDSNNLSLWTDIWYETIKNLPKEYDVVKENAVRINVPDANPYRISSLLYLRKKGQFSFLDYQKMKSRLCIVSSNSASKFLCASLCPKVFAKWVLKGDKFL